MDALMAEVIEGHIRFHILDPNVTPSDEQAQAADDLISRAPCLSKIDR
jgi:hypothetical protein